MFGITSFSEYLTQGLAFFMNQLVMIMGFVLSLAGYLLNFSISLTLNIKSFVDSTPAIFSTWRAIRDISGIFMIFLLLYAAIQLILGLKSNSFGSLIKNIVIVGLLINFSFFFAGLGIDVSNIISVQLYNAIAPANTLTLNKAQANSASANASGISFRKIDGGISDIFMNSLKIQSVSQKALADNAKGTDGKGADGVTSQVVIILMSGVVAVMIEFVAALSFVAASAAFIFRFVILIMLLAFSPVWILGIGDIIPGVKEYADRWKKHYLAMLQFMPVYLLLMYLALNILTSNPGGLFGGVNGAAAVGNGAWYSSILVFGVNAFIVCFLLNMPLVVAASMGDMATKFMGKLPISSDALWKKFGNKAYQGTLSRASSKIADSETFKNIASRSRIGAIALKGTRAVAADYNQQLSKQVKTRTEFADSLGQDKRTINQLSAQRRTIEQQQALHNASGNTAAATALNANIQAIDSRIDAAKTSRQASYASTINSGSYDTLYSYVARKNKVAASKLQVGAVKSQLGQASQALQRAQGNVTSAQNAVTTQQNAIQALQQQIATGQARNPTQAAAALVVMQNNLATAQRRLLTAQGAIPNLLTNPQGTGTHDLEARIAEMESIS